MLLTKAQAQNIFRNSIVDPDFTLVEEGDWEDEGKYSAKATIFAYKEKYYSLVITRTGTYFTSYDFEYDLECPEVFKKTILMTVWSSMPEGAF